MKLFRSIVPILFLFCSVASKGQGNGVSLRDSVLALKKMELAHKYGVDISNVYQCGNNCYTMNVNDTLKEKYVYVDSLKKMFLIGKSFIRTKGVGVRINIDTVYFWQDSSVIETRKKVNCHGTEFFCVERDGVLDSTFSFASYTDSTMIYSLYHSTYQKDSVSNKWVQTQLRIRDFHDLPNYEYKITHSSSHPCQWYFYKTTSLFSNHITAKKCAEDSLYSITDLYCTYYDTVENKYLRVRSMQGMDSVGIQWYDENNIKPVTGEIRCKLLPNGVMTPLGHNETVENDSVRWTYNYVWNTNDSTFVKTDSVGKKYVRFFDSYNGCYSGGRYVLLSEYENVYKREEDARKQYEEERKNWTECRAVIEVDENFYRQAFGDVPGGFYKCWVTPEFYERVTHVRLPRQLIRPKTDENIYALGLPKQQNWFDSSDERQGISYNYEADGFNTLKEW